MNWNKKTMNQDRARRLSPAASATTRQVVTSARLAIALASADSRNECPRHGTPMIPRKARKSSFVSASAPSSARRRSTADCSSCSPPTPRMSPASRSMIARPLSKSSASTSMAFEPGQEILIDSTASGYPLESLRQVPPGKYRAQALLHLYETFHRGDGHVVKLPMDRGEGQQWNKAPGNLYSTPQDVTIAAEPGAGTSIVLRLDKVIPEIPAPATTKYIKHERIQSDLLTKFWGRPMHSGRPRAPARRV